VTEVSTIGLDLAKNVFQAHGASASGAILFRKRLRRDQVLAFFAAQPRCLVAMEACASAHYWAREIAKLGHEVRLIAPAYVKPFVKRQKNNAADAEAICEAAQRPTMRFVAVKSEAKQASAVVFRTRDLLVSQRTQIINAIRGHLAEYGLIARQGPSHVDQLIAQIEHPSSGIPDPARSCLAVLVETLRALQGKIAALDTEIAARAKRDDGARRLMSIPGIGPLIATAIEALAPPVETFPLRPRLCGLGWADAAAAVDRRSGAPWKNIPHGRAHPAAPADHWGQWRGALGAAQGRARGLLAGAHACPQAADAGDGGAGQQDGADRVGVDRQGRKLSSSGRRRISGRRA
jgi:transposase